MVKQLMIATLLLGACGGGKKGDTTPEGGLPTRDYENQPTNDDNMIPPEKAEQIMNLLQRKERIMSRCLADAVDAKELPRNSRGKITLDIVVNTNGSSDVKIVSSSLESDKLKQCVIGHVKTIVFPEIPTTYPTSYTYGFEAM
ncbi:MAG: AgmX/PglI C-terminal domain-containing protein [Kofleriaceae bacterium]